MSDPIDAKILEVYKKPSTEIVSMTAGELQDMLRRSRVEGYSEGYEDGSNYVRENS